MHVSENVTSPLRYRWMTSRDLAMKMWPGDGPEMWFANCVPRTLEFCGVSSVINIAISYYISYEK